MFKYEEKTAKEIVEKILEALADQKGFANWWHDTVSEDRQDITEILQAIITPYL